MTLSKSFFLLTAAFLALATFLIALTVALSTTSDFSTGILVAVIAAGVAAPILTIEGKRDLDAVLTLLCAISAIAAVSVIVYLFSADRVGVAPKIAAPLASASAVALGTATYRRQKNESPDFPNVLARNVHYKSIFETEGVQFTGFVTVGGGGQPHFLVIVLQNCFDSPRDVTITLDPAGREQYLRMPLKHTVRLGPAEVSRTAIPVVTPTYPGQYPIYIALGVRKSQGKRVRLWRAQEATNRVKPVTTAALLAVGHLAVGGGIRVSVGPLPDDLWNAELPPVATESLWQPRIGTVPLVQSVA